MKASRILLISTVIISSVLALSACSGVKSEAKYPTRDGSRHAVYEEPESIFGPDGLSIFGNKNEDKKTQAAGIGVNRYLWRASLDTVSIMPIASADPFGGTILTDWYSPEGSKDERLKVNIFILSQDLRSDGIRVSVFRQKLKNGTWIDVETDKNTGTKMEDTILTRARQIRVAGAANKE